MGPLGKEPKLTPSEFVDILLARSDDISKTMYHLFWHDLGFAADPKQLELEARILSFWIITLLIMRSIPSLAYCEMLHAAYAERMSLTKEQARWFCDEAQTRYRTYSEAFIIWRRSPCHPDELGPAIIDTIMNGNVGRTVKHDGLPLVDEYESSLVTGTVMDEFRATERMVGKIKRERGIERFP